MKRSAGELAAAFDGSFALARTEPAPVVDVLAIGIGPDRFALRLAHVAGMFSDRTITKVPSRRTDLLGLATFRGSVVPVFDLATRLGYASAGGSARWLVLAAGAPVAFAFERFAGHVRIAASAAAGDVVVLDGAATPVIDIEALARAIAGEVR